jgi:hypothetical protein
MSAASLNNKTLQLAELIISNEKYAGSTGYVAASSTFSSSLVSTSMSVPSITSDSIELINGANSITLSCSGFETLAIPGTCNVDSLGIVNGINSVPLSCSAQSTLSVGGTCNASVFGIVNGNNEVPLTCPADATLSVAAGAGIVETGQVVLTVGTINGTAGGAMNLISDAGTAIYSTISGTEYSGILSVNAAGALLWNGNVIS